MSSDPERVGAAGVEDILDLRWQVLREGRPRHSAHMPHDEAPDTRHWAAWQGDRVVGCVTVMAEDYPDGPGPRWRLRGMAVAGDRQRTGVGSRLLRRVHRDVGAPLWCDARLHAIPFYEAHGWLVRSDVYEVANVGPHRRMIWPGPGEDPGG